MAPTPARRRSADAGTTNGSNATDWSVTPVLAANRHRLSQSGLSAGRRPSRSAADRGVHLHFYRRGPVTTATRPPGVQLVTMPLGPGAPSDVEAVISDTSATISWTSATITRPGHGWTVTPVQGAAAGTPVVVGPTPPTPPSPGSTRRTTSSKFWPLTSPAARLSHLSLGTLPSGLTISSPRRSPGRGQRRLPKFTLTRGRHGGDSWTLLVGSSRPSQPEPSGC